MGLTRAIIFSISMFGGVFFSVADLRISGDGLYISIVSDVCFEHLAHRVFDIFTLFK